MYRDIRPLVAGKRSDTATLPNATPDEMNSFFVDVGPRVAASLASSGVPPDVPCRLPRVGACGFQVAELTLAELREVVFSMKRSGACGPDGVCIRILLRSFEPSAPSCSMLVTPVFPRVTMPILGSTPQSTPSLKPVILIWSPITVLFRSSSPQPKLSSA